VEDDLVNDTWSVLPRIMQRLLYVLSYDRKVTYVPFPLSVRLLFECKKLNASVHRLHNWQTALRKQYHKRDPAANPIGPEPRVEDSQERESPPSPPEGSSPKCEETIPDIKGQNGHIYPESSDEKEKQDYARSARASTVDLDTDAGCMSVQLSEYESDGMQLCGHGILEQEQEQRESKDWLELPMLVKLDSMHILMEWQFQNPTRLRTLMRSDDENASWVRCSLFSVTVQRWHVCIPAYRTYRIRWEKECVLANWRHVVYHSSISYFHSCADAEQPTDSGSNDTSSSRRYQKTLRPLNESVEL